MTSNPVSEHGSILTPPASIPAEPTQAAPCYVRQGWFSKRFGLTPVARSPMILPAPRYNALLRMTTSLLRLRP